MTLFRRRPDAEHPAAADGERLHPGWIAQPVSAASSAAYLLAAAALVPLLPPMSADRADRSGGRTSDGRAGDCRAPGGRALALSMAANGLGSMGFHGPGDRISHRLHDRSLWSIIGVLGAGVIGELTGGRPPGRRATVLRGLVAPGVALAAGAVINRHSRTGGRWCRPDSLWQGHAAWHVISAAAVGHAGRVLFGR